MSNSRLQLRSKKKIFTSEFHWRRVRRLILKTTWTGSAFGNCLWEISFKNWVRSCSEIFFSLSWSGFKMASSRDIRDMTFSSSKSRDAGLSSKTHICQINERLYPSVPMIFQTDVQMLSPLQSGSLFRTLNTHTHICWSLLHKGKKCCWPKVEKTRAKLVTKWRKTFKTSAGPEPVLGLGLGLESWSYGGLRSNAAVKPSETSGPRPRKNVC